MNVAHTDRRIEGLRFVFVELPKFKPQSIAEKGEVRETTECLVEGNADIMRATGLTEAEITSI